MGGRKSRRGKAEEEEEEEGEGEEVSSGDPGSSSERLQLK